MDLPLKPRKKVTPSRGRLSAGGLFVFTCPYRFCRIRSSAYKRIYKVGNRLCEKNLHFYFNFTNPIPYSHGVRRQQTDQMFPCKEKSICYKRRKCYEKDFVSEKDYRYSRHSGHDLCDGCRRFYRRTYQRLLHAHRRDSLPIICRSPVPPTRWISGIDGTAPGAFGRPPPQAAPIKTAGAVRTVPAVLFLVPRAQRRVCVSALRLAYIRLCDARSLGKLLLRRAAFLPCF